jgi:hypothetical protein
MRVDRFVVGVSSVVVLACIVSVVGASGAEPTQAPLLACIETKGNVETRRDFKLRSGTLPPSTSWTPTASAWQWRAASSRCAPT